MSANLLRFYFNIDFVQPNYEVQREIRDAQQNWYPPTDPDAVSLVATTGWRKWELGSITQAQVSGGNNFRECSLFYDSERDHFLGVPLNCKKRSVGQEIKTRDARYGWRRLTFKHPEPINNGNHISVLDFDAPYNVLAAPGSPRWMPELMPQTYDYNDLDENVFGNTALAGNLALLIGLAAFSGPFPEHGPDVELTVEAIRAFRPPNWVPHGMRSRRVHSRGVIVSIKSIGSNDASLDKWSQGHFGALINP
ncbi:conserved hypothetical protein [Histoplasma capsulatum var. duboisii H88]|uniref:Uncharacterized protein n=2 Tax=Ajellomyces capsulatus TaxID=5037 RepID=F0UQB5_AJEC8|nr:conserved hypothetical protein [Histoplasma capsulatum H143]EGC47113.1 conserved hypothetical protein [Histoplasma capsulatum var. duboisii H88]